MRLQGSTLVAKTSTVSKRVGMIWDTSTGNFVPNPDMAIVQQMQALEYEWTNTLTEPQREALRATWETAPPQSANGRSYVSTAPTTWNQTQVSEARQYAWSTTYQRRNADDWPVSAQPLESGAAFTIISARKYNDRSIIANYTLDQETPALYLGSEFAQAYPPGKPPQTVPCYQHVGYAVYFADGQSREAIFFFDAPITVTTGWRFDLKLWIHGTTGAFSLGATLFWNCP